MGEEQLYTILITIGRAAGIWAFCLLGATIFLGGAKKLLMKSVKGATLLKLHERVGYLSYGLLIFHPIMIVSAKTLGKLTLADFISSYIGYSYFIAGLAAFTIFTLVIIVSLMRKAFKRWLWLNLMRVAIIAHLAAAFHLYRLGSLSGPYGQYPPLNIFIISALVLTLSGALIRLYYLTFKRS